MHVGAMSVYIRRLQNGLLPVSYGRSRYYAFPVRTTRDSEISAAEPGDTILVHTCPVPYGTST